MLCYRTFFQTTPKNLLTKNLLEIQTRIQFQKVATSLKAGRNISLCVLLFNRFLFGALVCRLDVSSAGKTIIEIKKNPIHYE